MNECILTLSIFHSLGKRKERKKVQLGSDTMTGTLKDNSGNESCKKLVYLENYWSFTLIALIFCQSPSFPNMSTTEVVSAKFAQLIEPHVGETQQVGIHRNYP